ncbi:VanZ family protein [Frigoribacterium sp. CG_9.8]|uniref:VanZ family protein n=1 Tax=Frigoribacterium sp. CG_9.8 TaxID=2787733 RepID=UPI0018CA7523|nr:VanZ family protein [Frigoribacterium sp. CG_9.8]MBG6107757.1 glycopeptide antibiotics resistance protein [Frigoribacterium sp. CG_9.8]
MFRRHPLLTLVTVGYLTAVGWITLGPQPINTGTGYWLWRALRFFSNYESTRWLTYDRVEFLSNVAMFLPIGVFFVLLFGRRLWFISIISGVLLTCAIELAQRFMPGRVSDVRDIVANSVGTVAGVLIALVLTRAKARQLRTQRA